MKKLLLLFGGLFSAAVLFAQQNFEVLTKKPTPGSVITIEYLPRNTPLQGVKDFEATAYLLEGGLPRAVEIPLKQEGGLFRGSVRTADSTRAVFFSFSKDEKRDNNNDQGYFTPLYDKSGHEVTGAKAVMAAAYQNYGGIWDLKRDAEKAASLNKEEFSNAASREKFANDYLFYLGQSKNEADKELLKTEMAKRLERKDLSESDLQTLRNYYGRLLKDKEKADAVYAQVKERYPNGAWKREEALRKFFTASAEDKQRQYDSLTATLNAARKEDAAVLDQLNSAMANAYISRKEYAKALPYFKKINNASMAAGLLNNQAWRLAGEGINKTPVDVENGLMLSKLSLDLLQKEKKELKQMPPFVTARRYADQLNDSYNMYADTYATLLYHKGDYEQAYAIEKKAVEGFRRKDVSMNEAFAALTEKIKGPKEAQTELETFFEEGKYTPAMKEQLKRLYLAGGKTEAEFTAYANAIEERAYNKLKAELARQMLNLPAPLFSLKNLEGKEVSLASLKGKVVVVDFWATWCGPCIASFPGMQTAVNKFRNNPDVAFVFIDTWENDSNRVQKVTDFIAKNKYSFNVLYDQAKAKEGNEFVVIEQYKVDGIPTKFVIDRNSNIRFKTVGFSGSADATVAELSAMIDMAAEASGGAFKKAL